MTKSSTIVQNFIRNMVWTTGLSRRITSKDQGCISRSKYTQFYVRKWVYEEQESQKGPQRFTRNKSTVWRWYVTKTPETQTQVFNSIYQSKNLRKQQTEKRSFLNFTSYDQNKQTEKRSFLNFTSYDQIKESSLKNHSFQRKCQNRVSQVRSN